MLTESREQYPKVYFVWCLSESYQKLFVLEVSLLIHMQH